MSIKICTAIKNEQLYFDHWKKWHEDRGFEITAYIDDCSEFGDYDCTNKYVTVSLPVWQKRQVGSMNEYLDAQQNDGNWTLFIDCDEYCWFSAEDVRQLTQRRPDARMFKLWTVPYVADNPEYLERYSCEPVTERFTRMSAFNKWQEGKLLVKHIPGIQLQSMHYATGAIIALQYSCIVRHYVTKSREEWAKRHPPGGPTSWKYAPDDFDKFNGLI